MDILCFVLPRMGAMTRGWTTSGFAEDLCRRGIEAMFSTSASQNTTREGGALNPMEQHFPPAAPTKPCQGLNAAEESFWHMSGLLVFRARYQGTSCRRQHQHQFYRLFLALCDMAKRQRIRLESSISKLMLVLCESGSSRQPGALGR